MNNQLTLISHHLCPYVQRAIISLTEKGVPFEKIYIDLSNKPDWFKTISPLGKVPLLKVGEEVIFESSVILEYLEETQPNPFHPLDPIKRARHRAWMEFGSSVLNDIAKFYSAKDAFIFRAQVEVLIGKFDRLEKELGEGPWFAGEDFSLVDTVFGPIFRYFEVFDTISDFGILRDKPKVNAWRKALAARSSVARAVPHDYHERLKGFLTAQGSHLTNVMHTSGLSAA